MINKQLSNKNGGSEKGLDYLLNPKRVKDGTAKILRGDEETTRQLISTIKNKQKLMIGVLSFEEVDIREEQKQVLMDDFETVTFAGLDKDQYNILWVQHTDKGRLELNYAIVKIELSTGKSFNPYFDRADRSRLDVWKKIQNIKYGFSDPDDPSRSQTVKRDKTDLASEQSYDDLNRLIHTLVEQGELQSRADIIETLEEQGIKVTRKNYESISIRLPEAKKSRKFKGAIYGERFTCIEGFEEVFNRERTEVREYDLRNKQKELEHLEARLEKYTNERARKIREKYTFSTKMGFASFAPSPNHGSVCWRSDKRPDNKKSKVGDGKESFNNNRQQREQIFETGRELNNESIIRIRAITRKRARKSEHDRADYTERKRLLLEEFENTRETALKKIRRDEAKVLRGIGDTESKIYKELTNNYGRQYLLSKTTQRKLRQGFVLEQSIEHKNTRKSNDLITEVNTTGKSIERRSKFRGARGAIRQFANRMAAGFELFKLAIVNIKKRSKIINKRKKIRRI